MSADDGFLPAATLLRHAPDSPLAATPAGSTVHVLNRPGGAPLCGRTPSKLAQLPPEQPAPPLRVCGFCIPRLPAVVQAGLDVTAADATAVREHAARSRPEPTTLPGLD